MEKEKFFISDAINETLRMMEGTIHRHGLQIEINCIKKAQINGYLSQFSQVLVNLINNSKDAYNQKDIQDKRIEITIDIDKKGRVVILFEDFAGGINSSVIDKIFYPYFTTKHSSSGTGLGLYMSKMIVENSMGGNISVQNKDDGAIFKIIVPQAK
jgi:C4-dicarboxylate-specific signal transduction histidine kinase